MSIDYRIVRLRCLAIMIVVFGHSIIIYDPQWGLYSTTNTCESLMLIKHIINTFQMPLFLFLSGGCFGYSVHKHSYCNMESIWNGIIGKIKRLLVPFIIVACFWMIPIRKLCNYLPWENLDILQIIGNVILGVDSGHLWFLPTLFLIFVLGFIVLTRVKSIRAEILLLLLTFVLELASSKIPYIFFLSYVASSLYWFCLGFVTYKHKEKFSYIRSAKFKFPFLGVTSAGIILSVFLGNGVIIRLFQGMLVTLFLLNLYNITSPEKCNKICEKISDESMGIYLLHSPLIYFTYAYFADANPIVVVFVNFVIDGMIAFALTCFLRKTRLKVLLGY